MNVDMLMAARAQVADVLEELGTVAMHLREAMDFAGQGSVETAADCATDAQESIENARRELLKIHDRAGRWAVWASGKGTA